MKIYDLIVVGGGPAGSSAGRRAGMRGLDTLLLEKQQFPRYKPCGGVLSDQALAYLDFPLPAPLMEREIFGARVHYHGSSVERYKNYRFCVLVTRSAFDAYLLEKAGETGIEMKTGEKVRDVLEMRDHVEVVTDSAVYRSRFLILSDGYQGRLSGRVRGREPRNRYGICMVTEIPEEESVIEGYIHNALDIHLGVADWGYGWIFPHAGYFSVGIGGIAEDLPNLKETFRRFLASSGFLGDYTVRSHTIPAGGLKRTISSSRTLLTGDAAGFVDCCYGEGIAYAIRSGQIAVDVLSGVVSGDGSTLKAYERICEREFGGNLRYSLYLALLMRRFPDLFARIFTSKGEILDTYLEICARRMTYREFITWLLPRVPGYLASR
jgi:geranylgeranyl reductase family protein